MNVVLSKIKAFVQEEDGLAAVEYAVIAALIAAGLILAFTNLGDAIRDTINELTTTIGGTTGT